VNGLAMRTLLAGLIGIATTFGSEEGCRDPLSGKPDAFEAPTGSRIRVRDHARHEGRDDKTLLFPKMGKDEIEQFHPAMGCTR
jgi:hypothetical protein